MKKTDQRLVDDVKKYGCHIVKVFDNKGELPDFAYSVGVFHSFRQPEIVVFGLDLNLMQDLINNIVRTVKSGTAIVVDKPYAGFLCDYNCVFRLVDKQHYSELFGYAQWFYKSDDFPVLQCFWPDKKHFFPWQEGFSQPLLRLQPFLF
ncbi:MAG: DUF4262 domain-containing protein [Acidobacteria bacterium]|nr:DUF4262 domain-containing protein [Acidobacteriota bacterium]